MPTSRDLYPDRSQPVSVFARRAGSLATGESLLLGQVMFLVAVAIGFLAAGSYIGRNLAFHTAQMFSFAGLGMILIQSFAGRRMRVGTLGMVWLYALALLIGLGLGPIISHYATLDRTVLYEASGGTALTVLGMGAFGLATSRDIVRWMRPLFWALVGLIVIGLVMLLVGAGGNPLLSLGIYVVCSLLLAVDFQYLRRYASEDDAIIIATGIFINIVNIFVSLLNILGSNR